MVLAPRVKRGLAAAAGILLLTVSGWFVISSALPDKASTENRSQTLPEGIGFEQRLNQTIPQDVVLVDSTGSPVRLGDVVDRKPVVLNLIYFECPMLCNMSMDGLIRTLNTMQLRVGRDFDVVTISFDPREGPELASGAKRTAVSRYSTSGDGVGWHFLTGDSESLDRVTDAVGFRYTYDEQTGQFAHAAGVVIVTPTGRISRYISGVDYAARDLRLSLVEASADRIGTFTDQAMLLCYRYDPLTGKYGLAISRAIQFAAFLTVAAMFGGIALSLWYERDKRHLCGEGLGPRDTAKSSSTPS